MARRFHSFPWLAAAVMLPLLVLAALAWLGTRAQLRGAWNEAREDAEFLAAAIANDLPGELAQHIKAAPNYPDPPPPGPELRENDTLAGDNIRALRILRDDPAVSFSPAGLPKRALAAAKVLSLVVLKDRADAEAAIKIATEEAPSILTPKILEEAETRFPGISTQARQQWDQGDRIRRLAATHPEISEGSPLISEGNVIWINEGAIRYVDTKGLEKTITAFHSRLPRWAALRVSSEGSLLTGAHEGEPMASITLPGKLPLEIGLVATRRDLIESTARTQARWTLALLSFAVGIAALGLWLIHRVLERERRLNALKSDFVASVSHELRAPIASIRLMADALESGKIKPETATEFHRLISREGSRLSTLIENVLDFARIEQGRKQWRLEETDLLLLIADTVTLMEPLAGEKNISLRLIEAPGQATAMIDPGAIQQALVNLLDNAIKFSPADSVVEVRLADKNHQWLLTITDQGPGIPADEQERIFEKFHRLGNELRRETQGTGIGLSLVKAIAEAHGGSITVESLPGNGSTFSLTLPNIHQTQP